MTIKIRLWVYDILNVDVVTYQRLKPGAIQNRHIPLNEQISTHTEYHVTAKSMHEDFDRIFILSELEFKKANQ